MAFEGIAPIGFEGKSNVTATLGVNSPELGTKKIFSGEEYLYVYNAGNSQISKGYGAVLSATTGYSVTVSAIAVNDLLMGFCKHSTLTTGTYGWLLTRGFTDVKNGMASTALAAGDLLSPAVDGAVQLPTGATTAPINGKVLQATGSAGTGYAYIRCFG